MSVCANSVDYGNLDNDENSPINVNWHIKDQKNYSGSQEIFSDDDRAIDTSCNSPKVSVKNDTFNSSVISMKTPKLCSRTLEETPGRAAVPRTPADLLPFIKKTSFLWTSDMETPQSKINDQSRSCDRTCNSIDSINKTPTKPTTPAQENMVISSKDLTSPVLGGKKRSKRKVKRRILNNLNLESDNNNDRQGNVSSDKVPSEPTSSASSEVAFDIHKEVDDCESKESNNLENLDCRENKLLEEAVNPDKNSNTSTQDFFSNASFSSIDKLCSTAIPEEKDKPAATAAADSNEVRLNIDQASLENKESNISKNVSEELRNKVAAIRKIKKPMRRSIDISHPVIPKEVFSKSVMDLELADAKFSQEKKPVANKPKSLGLMTFSKLASLDNVIENIYPSGKNAANPVDVPVKTVNNQNINKCATASNFSSTNVKISVNSMKASSSKSAPRKELGKDYSNEKSNVDGEFIDQKETRKFYEQPRPPHVKHDLVIPDNTNNQDTDGFMTAKGRGISISEDKLISRTKIYQEIEKEIDENSFLGSKQKKEQPTRLLSSLGKQAFEGSKKTEKLKLDQDFELELKSLPEDMNVASDGFGTARGRKISISKEKEDLYLKVYNDLSDDVNFSTAKKTSTTKLVTNQPFKNIVSNRKSTTSSTASSSDGFQTARGSGIQISEEKESLALKRYNELSDDIDFSTAKKPNTMKPVVNQPVKSNAFKRPEIVSSKTSGNGFETARGGQIAVSNEKEKEFLKFYNELDDVDDDSLLNIKTNKQSKKGLSAKPTDKVVLVFNNKKTTVKPSAKNIEISAKSSNDGFSTAKGIDIPTSSDKENHYLNICNQLSDDIPGDSSKTKLHGSKQFVIPKQIKTETVDVKQEMEEIGDLAELFFSPPHQSNFPESMDSNFIVPNSSNILKKIDVSTIPQAIIKKEELDHKPIVDKNETSKPSASTEGKPAKNHIGLLKRRLDDCEAKRTGRCRSFGGFPANDESVSAVKLNKSDPHNDSSVNQPLQKCLSVSQCFDAHSDSWLSKVEISYLNGSKINSPKVRKQTIESASTSKAQVSSDCSGFSPQDRLESLDYYVAFKSFLKKHKKKCEKSTALIKAGHSVLIKVNNQTQSNCQLLLQCKDDVDVKRGTDDYTYVLTKAVPKKIESIRVEPINSAIEIGKRKHLDTDSDTPLTSVKKPRVGSELQGRKLFSDESDEEEGRTATGTSKGGLTSTQSVTSMDTQETELEEEAIDLTEERKSAILYQEKIIRNKKRMKIKPVAGKLLSDRLENSKNRKSWSDLVGSSVPRPLNIVQIKQNHPDAKILDVTASSATCYSFVSSIVTGKKNIVSLDMDDGASLIFDKNGQAGVAEFSQAFLAMPSVDPKLLPTGWVENHYKWIVWKLAALDRIQFGSAQLPKSLTPQRVMSELKYRYDREIDKAQRPALRRILEKDDVPSRRMVLCISSIKECAVAEESDKEVRTMLGLPRWKVEATDGWYDIPLTVDSAMANYISTGKIKEGTKIITYGAELMECERGFFPLEKPPNVSLKIHTNCTRRAKWDTKLGYQKTSRPLPVKLRDIISAGGMIGEITAAAARVYPVLYREKTADGKSIYRNARCEEKAAIAHEHAVEKRMDAMYAEAQKNFDSKKKSELDEDFDSSQTQISNKLNHYERKQEEFKRRIESQVRENLPPRRDVTTVLKVRLADDSTTVILSIWGAGEESDCDIREGDTVSVYNCMASGHRGGDLHLTANRITHIKTEPLLKLPYPNRVCTLIPDIMVAGFEPKFGEFDTVGVVVSSGSAPYGMKNFEMVNMAYPKPDDGGSSYLSVLFWNGVASFGYQGMFTPGSFVACSNLEWRRNLWSIAVAYCSEKSVFTGNPRQAHLMKELRNLKALVQNPQSYAESCVEEVAAELAKKPQRTSQGTPTTSWSNNDRSTSFASPADIHTPGNVSFQKRYEKLSRYGPSPEISPIVINSNSSKIKKEFTPVTRRNT